MAPRTLTDHFRDEVKGDRQTREMLEEELEGSLDAVVTRASRMYEVEGLLQVIIRLGGIGMERSTR